MTVWERLAGLLDTEPYEVLDSVAGEPVREDPDADWPANDQPRLDLAAQPCGCVSSLGLCCPAHQQRRW